jgi:polysaccharide export outer membrane protein
MVMTRRIVLVALTCSLCAISISPAQETRPSSPTVYVVGEVLRPGTVAITSPTTVLKALVGVGFRDNAAVDKIEIVRGGSRLKFNFKEVVRNEAHDQNVILRDGDVIVVPSALRQ